MGDGDITFPDETSADERELLLRWLAYLRGAVIRNASGISDDGAHWRPDGRLISLIGIVNHLTKVEWRWIDGGMLINETARHARHADAVRELLDGTTGE